jgi:chemotaxis protein MotB
VARSRRDFGPTVNIWPGFVDALSTLILVFVFLLVVFTLAQFFLNQLLQGKDTRLHSLEQAIAELTSELDMEQATNAELRQSVTRLSSDLQAAVADRDDSAALLADTEAERDEFRERVLTLEDQQAALTRTLNSLRLEADRLEDVETRLEQTTDVRDRLQQELERAQQTIAADRDAIELQLAQLVQLRRDIEALTKVRDGLEGQVAETTALLQAAEQAKAQAADQLAQLSSELEAAQKTQSASQQRSEQLTAELETARRERSSLDAEIGRLAALLLTAQTEGANRAARVEELSATAEELQRAREQLLLELSQVRDRSAELEASLASEQERTTLAQTELEQRDIRIAELLRSGGRTEDELAIEQTLSREALDQVDILNRQINALRVQLAALEQALDLEQQRVEEQEVTIADLGGKLNLALAGKVEELSRFRSEFFGRLRELLGDRPDVRIVGDRFVFQSEVLFPSASAEIGTNGRDELRKLAQSLREIAADMPTDVPWVLQIDGHTDRRPIRTPEFPSNWELSTARAINVGRFLIDEGIPPERIAVAGFGAFHPIDDRDDEIAYRRNRRIEIKLTNP